MGARAAASGLTDLRPRRWAEDRAGLAIVLRRLAEEGLFALSRPLLLDIANGTALAPEEDAGDGSAEARTAPRELCSDA